MNTIILRFLRLFAQFRLTESLLDEVQSNHQKQSGCCGELVKVKAERDRSLGNCHSLAATISDLKNQLASAEADIESLRNANDELTTEKTLLEDRLESALADKQRLWDTMQSALSGERLAYQMQVNHAVQKSGGGIPYPDAHSLPAEVVRKPQVGGSVGRRGRVLPSQQMAEANRQFIQSFLAEKTEHQQ